jgi:NADP-dependent aldehyde dehydrogenase
MTTLVPDTVAGELDAILAAADRAAPWCAALAPGARRDLCCAIADALDAAADELVPLAQRETHLAEPRLRGELARTTFQLRLLGNEVVSGRALEIVLDPADPDWPAGGRPDLRRLLVPLGPVAVFAAGNFPFAFSVAGGDTAAALAAGCPVIVKAHPGHPELSQRTAAIVRSALAAAGAAEGAFALVHGVETGRALVTDERITAGAFTGSSQGGRALADLAAARPHPIPFNAEMGSVNPVFVTPGASAARLPAIADGYVASYLLGAGQFCTKPGLLFVPEAATEPFLDAAARSVRGTDPALLLNQHIATAHAAARERLVQHPGVREVVAGSEVAPALLATSAAQLVADPGPLTEECFGPTSLVVSYANEAELDMVVRTFTGELTATVHGEADEPLAAWLVQAVGRFAGRVVWNGWPTGVAVSAAMQHGGPYPAALGAFSSVGTTSIRRFQRPVTYQSIPDELLPPELRATNPLNLQRQDGHRA